MDEAKARQVIAAALGSSSEYTVWAQHLGREVLRYQIFHPKDPDANPYYPKNDMLHSCIAALRRLIEATGPKHCQGREQELLLQTAQAAGLEEKDIEELTSLLAESQDSIVKELVYFLTHDAVVIDRIAGGHRGTIKNDTEIDISVCLMPETHASSMDALIQEACWDLCVQLKKL